ncbi:MAG: acyl carrier protein [Moraxellaceae bacterium]|jgi:acyl carrier protein|nr:MAG: acyl carrier protein [Moraxellaceae bacterium]
MPTKESVRDHVINVIHELFDHPKEQLKGEVRLYEDLDIDSIDAVDMVVKLKEITGKKITPSDFKDVRTLDDVVNSVHKLLVDGEPAA